MISKNEFLNAKILIVDDDPTVIRVAKKILNSAGYTSLSTTSDSREAISLYRDIQPDLLMLDINMPNIDGYEILETLKRTYRDDYIPALVITARLDDETRLKALSVGAKDFLTKPFDQVEVVTRINNIIEVRLLNNELKRQKNILEVEHKEAEEIGRSLLRARPFDERINASVSVEPCSSAGGDRAGFIKEIVNGNGRDKEWLLVLDASGHGMGAAKFQEVALGGLLTMVSSGNNMKNALIASNRFMESLNTGRFLVGNVLRVMTQQEKPSPDGEVWIEELNVAQHPVMVLEPGKDEVDEWEWERGGKVGASLPLGALDYGLDSIESRHLLQKVGSRTVVYTDGLYEAKNDSGEMYGLERLKKMIVKTRDCAPEEARSIILGDIFIWVKGEKESAHKIGQCVCGTKDDISLAIMDITSA